MQNKRGGPGRGQGRKPLKAGEKTVSISFRGTESQKERFKALGGGKWVRDCIDAAKWPKSQADREADLLEEALDLLAVMFDAYEEGPDCYEDPEDCSGHLGKAVNLDDAAFERIADILNKHRPRNNVVTPNVIIQGPRRGPAVMEG